jgi:hypothetical protein
MTDSKLFNHKLDEIKQVRIIIEHKDRRIILADTWKINDNMVDGLSSGIFYPKDYPDNEIHVEVAIQGNWVRLW